MRAVACSPQALALLAEEVAEEKEWGAPLALALLLLLLA
jgi:hypothetical protein